jgi:hypothetical protein
MVSQGYAVLMPVKLSNLFLAPKKNAHYYKGTTVKWIVCDLCAKKERDRPVCGMFFRCGALGGLRYFSYNLEIPTGTLLLVAIGKSI